MNTVTHREMRNNSGDILRRVEAGETFLVSNNGRPAAVIVPAHGESLDLLIARGQARAARAAVGSLARIPRQKTDVDSRQIVDDSRGRW